MNGENAGLLYSDGTASSLEVSVVYDSVMKNLELLSDCKEK